MLTFALQLASFLISPMARIFTPENAQIVRWTLVACTIIAFPVLRYLAAKLTKRYIKQISKELNPKQ